MPKRIRGKALKRPEILWQRHAVARLASRFHTPSMGRHASRFKKAEKTLHTGVVEEHHEDFRLVIDENSEEYRRFVESLGTMIGRKIAREHGLVD